MRHELGNTQCSAALRLAWKDSKSSPCSGRPRIWPSSQCIYGRGLAIPKLHMPTTFAHRRQPLDHVKRDSLLGKSARVLDHGRRSDETNPHSWYGDRRTLLAIVVLTLSGVSGSVSDRRRAMATFAKNYPNDPVDVIIGDFMSEANMSTQFHTSVYHLLTLTS